MKEVTGDASVLSATLNANNVELVHSFLSMIDRTMLSNRWKAIKCCWKLIQTQTNYDLISLSFEVFAFQLIKHKIKTIIFIHNFLQNFFWFMTIFLINFFTANVHVNNSFKFRIAVHLENFPTTNVFEKQTGKQKTFALIMMKIEVSFVH